MVMSPTVYSNRSFSPEYSAPVPASSMRIRTYYFGLSWTLGFCLIWYGMVSCVLYLGQEYKRYRKKDRITKKNMPFIIKDLSFYIYLKIYFSVTLGFGMVGSNNKIGYF